MITVIKAPQCCRVRNYESLEEQAQSSLGRELVLQILEPEGDLGTIWPNRSLYASEKTAAEGTGVTSAR